MNRSTLIMVMSALAMFSLGASAAPPGGGTGGGMGGEHSMGNGMPGGMSSDHAATGRSSQDRPETAQHGRSVSDQLDDNAKLSSEIKDLTGTAAQQACAGFKSLGDCVSAAHVSKNLGISFDTLRAKLVGSGAVSLGKAIHELKPDANTKSVLREASRQTKEDLHGSG